MSGAYLPRELARAREAYIATLAYALLWTAGLFAFALVAAQHGIAYNYLVNGVIEFLGANALLLNVLKLYQQKQTRGVHWAGTAFFMGWGYWNIFYYPSVGDWWSFAGGLFVVTINTFWLGQMLYYRKN